MRVPILLAAIGAILSLTSALAAASQPASVVNQRISVKVEGAGSDIILIPGLASSRKVWAGLAEQLRQHYRLHLVQVAGFADSPAVPTADGRVAAPVAEAIADYIREQHIEAPVIIGHSLGGEVALMLGARHPERVGRLMVVDALPFYTLLIDPAATAESAAPHAAAFRDATMTAPLAQAEAMQRAAIARLAKTEAARPALIDAATRSDRKTVADATYELMTTDLRPELARIQAPVQVVYAYDALYGTPASSVDATFRNAYITTPDISFKRVDGSFHFIMLDQPQAFASTVIDFLGQGG
ncbi:MULTISPECIES: alpha/beta hydrolase [Pseudomonas]|uniref:alpha/beta fold hydrolase n=1 Tax=Pseudomonas TaxID=286 RepID=UPI002DB75D16|nr:alpha/beta hydrolase [Pseudomonas asiatica]MEB6592300.1 alpha/beta hydrolase [Pseudomonas asiatica]